MRDDLPFHSLTELSHLLGDGRTTSREIVEACLARIDRFDGQLHAFVEVYRDDALAAADTPTSSAAPASPAGRWPGCRSR